MASGLLDEPVDLTQTKPGTFARLFGRKEWLEGAVEYLFGHSSAAVGNRQQNVLAGLYLAEMRAIVLVQEDVASIDRQLAPVRHCITSVDRKIHNGGFKLSAVDLDLPNAPRAHDFELHPFAENRA